MAPTASRTIRRSEDVRLVLQTGARRPEGRVVLYVRPSEGTTRVAFVSSRRAGDAVDRNRARRLLREAWRALVPRIREGYDVVVMARPEIRGAKMQDVAEDLARALLGAGVIVE